MWRVVLESYWYLFRMAFAMRGRSGMKPLHDAVRSQRTRDEGRERCLDHALLCRAMDLACVLYPHRVLCLQRSAATTVLLRRNGIPADLVVGVKHIPFRSHAWVEVDGVIVNDKPYLKYIYQELERC